jgi:hypothetical protein
LIILIISIVIRIIRIITLRSTIRTLYIRLVEQFEENNIEYWTDFGTLLGMTRDHDIIIGDNDADVCIVPTSENIEKCKKVVENMGGEYLEWGAFRVYDGDVFVDIYIPTIIGNQYKNPTAELIDIDMIHPIQKKQTNLGGNSVIVSVPSQIENVLVSRYGDWRKNSRNWYTLYADRSKNELSIYDILCSRDI